MLVALSIFFFAVTLPTTPAGSSGQCASRAQSRAAVRSAALADSVADELSKLRAARQSDKSGEPSVVAAELEFWAAQKVTAATARNLRLPPARRNVAGKCARPNATAAKTVPKTPQLSLGAALAEPTRKLLKIASAVLQAPASPSKHGSTIDLGVTGSDSSR
ncbi:MAG TPA: hypothetical protein VF101_20410 [Gaiellaceae bacterium]